MPLSAEATKRLREQADKVRQRLQRGGQDFAKYAGLTGKNAIVEAGKTVIVRLLPRWDIAQSRMRDGKGKVVLNPKYPADLAPFIYVPAIEHWFDSQTTGRRAREWCRRVLGDDQACPLCEGAEALMGGDENDVAAGRQLRGKDVFLFNVLLRKAPSKEDGTPDIKILSVPDTVWIQINDAMTGGPESEAAFAYGEIFDVSKGRDIMITRPVKDSGDRYKVTCAPEASPLYPAEEAGQWKGWVGLLHDLPAEIAPDKVLSYDELYKALHGVAPEAERSSGAEAIGGSGGDDLDGDVASPGHGSDPFDPSDAAVDDAFGIGMPGEEEPPAAAKRPPAAATRPSAGKRR